MGVASPYIIVLLLIIHCGMSGDYLARIVSGCLCSVVSLDLSGCSYCANIIFAIKPLSAPYLLPIISPTPTEM